jgi:hypothetical protein
LVKTLLENRNESQSWSSNRAQEVVEYLRVDSPFLWERPPLDVINVGNGLLDVTAGRTKATFTGISFASTVARGVQRHSQMPCVGEVRR